MIKQEMVDGYCKLIVEPDESYETFSCKDTDSNGHFILRCKYEVYEVWSVYDAEWLKFDPDSVNYTSTPINERTVISLPTYETMLEEEGLVEMWCFEVGYDNGQLHFGEIKQDSFYKSAISKNSERPFTLVTYDSDGTAYIVSEDEYTIKCFKLGILFYNKLEEIMQYFKENNGL